MAGKGTLTARWFAGIVLAMVAARGTLVRRFDGSLADARGLLRVERATFDESPYNAHEVQAMLAGGSQWAWLATLGDDVIGFIIAFPTSRLGGSWWEMDLLAVDPDWAGRGLGRRLIRAAASGGSELADRARAVVATDNVASARAFAKAGFQPVPETHRLLIYRTGGRSLRPRAAQGMEIQEAADTTQALQWLLNFGPGLGANWARRVHQGEPAFHTHGTRPESIVLVPGQGAGSTCLLAGGEGSASGAPEDTAPRRRARARGKHPFRQPKGVWGSRCLRDLVHEDRAGGPGPAGAGLRVSFMLAWA